MSTFPLRAGSQPNTLCAIPFCPVFHGAKEFPANTHTRIGTENRNSHDIFHRIIVKQIIIVCVDITCNFSVDSGNKDTVIRSV